MTPKDENRCVCCGEVNPEGRQVSPSCEWGTPERGGESDADTGQDQNADRS